MVASRPKTHARESTLLPSATNPVQFISKQMLVTCSTPLPDKGSRLGGLLDAPK